MLNINDSCRRTYFETKKMIMKKLLTFALMCCMTGAALAQHTVSGTVTDLNSQPIANHSVSISSNVRTGPGAFQPIKAMTNSQGQYSGTLPTGLPNNTGIVVETTDCNSSNVVNNHNYTGSNITSNFSICTTPPATGISGQVYTTNTKRNIKAVVYRIEKCAGNPTTLALIDSVLTDTTGQYSFSSYPTLSNGCVLLMKAALLPADADYNNYLPSYHVSMSTSALQWSGATTITQQIAANGVDFAMTAGTNSGGPGFIGGSVLQGANKGTGVGDPVPNRIFVLTDAANKAIGYTHSDASGAFSFGNLPYGTYKIFGDAWGKNNPHLTVIVDNANPTINSVLFTETSKELKGQYTPNSVGNIIVGANVAVFPNPVHDVINIKGLNSIEGSKQVTVISVTGSVVYSGTIEQQDNIAIPAQNMAAGVYMLRIATDAGIIQHKIIK